MITIIIKKIKNSVTDAIYINRKRSVSDKHFTIDIMQKDGSFELGTVTLTNN